VAAYLDTDEFKLRTIIAGSFIDDLESSQPGWVDQQLESMSRRVDSRLRKRYVVPFATAPESVKLWVTQLATMRVFMRIYRAPTEQQQWVSVQEDYENAMAELKEAADSQNGLYDLPITDAADASAITKAQTAAYSEQSPYAAFDGQAAYARDEDRNGGGTFR